MLGPQYRCSSNTQDEEQCCGVRRTTNAPIQSLALLEQLFLYTPFQPFKQVWSVLTTRIGAVTTLWVRGVSVCLGGVRHVYTCDLWVRSAHFSGTFLSAEISEKYVTTKTLCSEDSLQLKSLNPTSAACPA